MKKIIFVMAALMAGSMMFGQTALNQTKKEVKADPNVQNLRMAYELADYGYENKSASALLQAAEILCQVSKKEAENVKVKQDGTSGDKAPAETKSYKSMDLVKDAKAFAGKDKTMLAWAKEVEKKAKVSTRGATGGSAYASNFAYANGGYTTYEWLFDKGRVAEVAVHSMDGADLDLYIFDENDNLIVCDEGASNNAYVSFLPYLTTPFRVVIKNNARYNATFEVYTN